MESYSVNFIFYTCEAQFAFLNPGDNEAKDKAETGLIETPAKPAGRRVLK